MYARRRTRPGDEPLKRTACAVFYRLLNRLSDRPIPLEGYVGALESAGLLLERLREPAPDDALVAEVPATARLRRIPLYLHFRALKP